MNWNTIKIPLLSLLLLIAMSSQAQLLVPKMVLESDTTEITDTLKYYFGEPQSVWQPITAYDRAQRSHLPFQVIFIPKGKKIEYKPTNFQQQKLDAYQNMLSGQSSTSLITNISDDPIEDVRYDYTVAHPDKVNYTWRIIPEPDKNIREGRRIKRDKRADLEKAASLIADNQYNGDSQYQLKLLPKEEPSPWTTSGQENLQVSQLFLENWAKGGESSMSLTSDFRYSANFKKDKHEWENNVTHKMGFTRTSTLGSRVSNDELNLSSKYGFKAVNNWYYSFQNTFKTQMFRNYASNDKEKKNPKSTLLSPAYIQFIFGMDYKKDNLSILLSPYTAIITVVADTSTIDQTKFSIPKNKRSNTVDGFSISVNWKKMLTRDITYSTKGEVFYEYFEKHGQKRLDWENIVDLQFNRFLSTRFLFELRYYDNESKKFQVKENISISFKYTF